MTKRRYNFLRLTSLLMLILGVLLAIAGIALGIIMIVRPSLLVGELLPADQRGVFTVIGGLTILGGLLGGMLLSALGQYFQAFLELLELNRIQVRGLKAMLDNNNR